jgi:hypothetical protein
MCFIEGNFIRAGLLSMAVFGFTTIMSFSICAAEVNKNYEMLDRAFRTQSIKNLKRDHGQ